MEQTSPAPLPKRYPGAVPFREDQQGLFFGRDATVAELVKAIAIEPITVLFAKSGIGKSSLLKAGLVPVLAREERLDCLSLRFGAFLTGAASPLETTLKALDKKAAPLPVDDDGSLWYALKRRIFSEKEPPDTFVLVVDQFEELFSYPQEQQLRWARQISEILYANVPQRFRDQLEVRRGTGKQDSEITRLFTPLRVCILVAIRSDRMSLLNTLRPYLPEILRHCVELPPLDKQQAEDAILLPAYLNNRTYYCPRFDYTNEALDYMIDYLTLQGKQSIESFQLQILCHAIERKVHDQGLSVVGLNHLTDLQSVYENYYDDQINTLPVPDDRVKARIFIEEGLIFEDENRRLSLYEGQIVKQWDISPELLRALVDTHLIRAEPSALGGFVYELSHDTLIKPVLEAKRKRRETLRIHAENQARLEQEAALRTERAKRIRARSIAVASAFLAFVAVAGLVIALWQYRIAEAARVAALEANALFLREEAKRRLLEVNQLRKKAERFQSFDEPLMALLTLERAMAIDSTHPDLKKEYHALLQQMDPR